jgi:hypothetical protein
MLMREPALVRSGRQMQSYMWEYFVIVRGSMTARSTVSDVVTHVGDAVGVRLIICTSIPTISQLARHDH